MIVAVCFVSGGVGLWGSWLEEDEEEKGRWVWFSLFKVAGDVM